MKLSALTGETCEPDPEISGLASDSRHVKRGDLFAALPGANFDGTKFVPQALEKGASAILADKALDISVPLIIDDNTRRRWAEIASKFYAPQPSCIAGITGTNGKTSTAQFVSQLWSMLGEHAGSIGTIGAQGDGYFKALTHTTPEPVMLHQTLREMAEATISHVAMEVSSHAIVQHRADGVVFKVAAFTNITQDHLDFHRDFDDYFEAKSKLFTALLPETGTAVINADGAGSDALQSKLTDRRVPILTTGLKGEDVALQAIKPLAHGSQITVRAGDEQFSLELPVIGGFQAENALLAVGIVAASGFDVRGVVPLLSELKGVPGRMENVASLGGASVYIDYAHTPAAITSAIDAIRPHVQGKLTIIIGAGGDRDAAKRPLMGAAALGADDIIVTDDNPRSEDPAAIRAAVMSGAVGAVEIAGREAAIEYGVAKLNDGDILLITGKGHESTQTIGNDVIPFHDGDVARNIVSQRKGAGIRSSSDD